MKGKVCHEVEAGLPAAELWSIYSTIRLAELTVKLLPNVVAKVDLLEGDGGLHSVIRVTFPSDSQGPKYHIEKHVRIDHEKRVKDVLVLEGGMLELGFTSYLIRFEIVEKDGGNSSIIKNTIEYEKDGEEPDANFASAMTAPFAIIGETIVKHLIETKA